MSDELAEKLRSQGNYTNSARRRVPTRDVASSSDAYQPFSLVSESRMTPPRLVFVFKNGNTTSWPYSDIHRVQFDGETITLEVISGEGFNVTIVGRNLNELHRNIHRDRVEMITEIDELQEASLDRQEDEAAVFRIAIKPIQEETAGRI